MPVVLSAEFAVSGDEIDFDIAEQIKAEGIELINSLSAPISVNLQGLVKANTVTVAVMSAWYRCAVLQKKSIEFVNLSTELNNIVEFSGLADTLLSRD